MPLTPDGDLCERWRQLMARYHDVSCALERALNQQHDLGVSEFEALDLLVKSPLGKQFVHELRAGMHLSQSALSRTVARLEKRGLVARAMCTDDRRAVCVTPTEEGRRVHAEASPTHAAVLAEHLGELQPLA
ncbi:MarR family winged helix-turn-helix transcriptional regulator [Nocardiopsis sp. NPDC050513]|uniref:MarR family winged helix-turn-helix transcriptional regulator n=1 Tax=Nocardiopsis sp. NPDC050513 TaxID=3364338 RepID=UPI0037AD76C7